ncbi:MULTISPECIES: hypothetical protein [unclassified Arthrobacter]|uniref:hypothetical protein n=1 Tax=unclassified Arthrobacter TaxID=235627 RepID=UPI001CFFC7EB|nr:MULTISPECIES: hypothetical protein [unclassified Arthrobacter]MCB5282253.1 hypothetical protein [Arthrobacter sp. ES1]WGZ80692.1 hypothetical protein QI450_05725 [Arthrobacter sp. EM1]
MATALSGRAAAFLRRACLLAGMLAVIAGILGMHIMIGTHVMPAPSAVPGTTMAMAAQTSAAVAPVPVGAAAQDTPAFQDAAFISGPPCADAGACAMMSAMDAACISFPGNPPLAAPVPGTNPFAATVPAAWSDGFATYPYLPGSPSPDQLSISRT